ncbi:hypothetical protein BDZ91DRAFT_53728 [Kalaharituber pfeilii]|nr:hypothetical protein BDZ91DRAFT_53728 [Kalaharituber pfeilii]
MNSARGWRGGCYRVCSLSYVHLYDQASFIFNFILHFAIFFFFFPSLPSLPEHSLGSRLCTGKDRRWRKRTNACII